MSLVAMKELLARAEEKGVAIGAFSVGNMEMVMGAVKAAFTAETAMLVKASHSMHFEKIVEELTKA